MTDGWTVGRQLSGCVQVASTLRLKTCVAPVPSGASQRPVLLHCLISTICYTILMYSTQCLALSVCLPLTGVLCRTENGVLYRVSQEKCARLREGVPYVKVYRYNPKHLYSKLNGYGDNGQRSLKL